MRNHFSPTSLILVVYFLFVGCAETRETPSELREYQAYGKTWEYFTLRHDTKRWGVNSPHGLFGVKEGTRQEIWLVSETGERIAVHNRIFALQSDGSYKKIECCYNVSTAAAVYNFESKLVLRFMQTRDKITDCFVYPANRPDDETRPPEKRARYVTLFGDFDPEDKIFRVSSFYPGGVSYEEATKRLGQNASIEKTTELIYSRRRPFMCDGEGKVGSD